MKDFYVVICDMDKRRNARASSVVVCGDALRWLLALVFEAVSECKILECLRISECAKTTMCRVVVRRRILAVRV
jgi:hypothetical protein